MTEDNVDFDAMFADNEDVFDGLDDVETWDRLPYFEPNHRYLLEVDSVQFVKSTNDEGVRFYILQFTIVESTCEALPAGTRAANIIKCSKEAKLRKYGPMNFKQFLSGVSGIPANKADFPWGKLAKSAVSEGVLNGERVRLQTSLNKAGTFTNHTFSKYDGALLTDQGKSVFRTNV
jgi:hypothetical protein